MTDPIEGKTQQNFHLEDGKIKEMLQNLHGLADVYNSTTKDDPDSLQRSNEGIDRNWKTIRSIQIQNDPPISLAIAKEYSTFKKDTKENGAVPIRNIGDKVEKIIFRFFKGSANFTSQKEINMKMNTVGNEIGDIVLEHKGQVWNLADRYVQKEFREKGFASALLKAAETFVEDVMKTTNLRQKIIMNAGQPSVLKMFQKKGYTPTAKDAELLQRMLVNDGSFELDYACVRGMNPDGSFADEWLPQPEKDLYCFEPGISPKSEQNATRVTLEKTFIPESENTDITKDIDAIKEGVARDASHFLV